MNTSKTVAGGSHSSMLSTIFVFSAGTSTFGLSACSGCLRLFGSTPPKMPLQAIAVTPH
nr:hypothetical protein [Pseudomonas sp. KBS0710]